jgi:hypothetical protein
VVESMSAFPPEAWSRYEQHIVKPNLEPTRPMGAYASEVRRRKRSGCPMHAP